MYMVELALHIICISMAMEYNILLESIALALIGVHVELQYSYVINICSCSGSASQT